MEQIIEFVSNHYLLTSAWVVVAILLLISVLKSATDGSKALGAQEVTTMINRADAQVVDIRPSGDFNKGHILGAKNVTMSKLKSPDKNLEKLRDKIIIVACANGMQAAPAVALLKKHGFENVHKLKGGMQGWAADNLPMVKG